MFIIFAVTKTFFMQNIEQLVTLLGENAINEYIANVKNINSDNDNFADCMNLEEFKQAYELYFEQDYDNITVKDVADFLLEITRLAKNNIHVEMFWDYVLSDLKENKFAYFTIDSNTKDPIYWNRHLLGGGFTSMFEELYKQIDVAILRIKNGEKIETISEEYKISIGELNRLISL